MLPVGPASFFLPGQSQLYSGKPFEASLYLSLVLLHIYLDCLLCDISLGSNDVVTDATFRAPTLLNALNVSFTHLTSSDAQWVPLEFPAMWTSACSFPLYCRFLEGFVTSFWLPVPKIQSFHID